MTALYNQSVPFLIRGLEAAHAQMNTGGIKERPEVVAKDLGDGYEISMQVRPGQCHKPGHGFLLVKTP